MPARPLLAIALMLPLVGCGDLFSRPRAAPPLSDSARCAAAAPGSEANFLSCMTATGWRIVAPPPSLALPPVAGTAGPRRSFGLEVRAMATPFRAPGYPAGSPGLLVLEAMPGGAAQAAGLLRGDILLGFGGIAVGTPEALQARLARIAPGSRIAVELTRDQAPMVAIVVF